MADAWAEHRRAATNTVRTYGWVERAFHWTIALLIPTVFVLGRAAHLWAFDSDTALTVKATLFSAHKTLGLVTSFVALMRIAWALSQPRPRPLHPDRKVETALAATVHWLLYGSLVIVPLMGWAHHATATGFAPIWWPFGQSLPFLPKDPSLSARFATLHVTFVVVLVASLALHVAGAFKHVFVDSDATLARMWRGADPGNLPAPSHTYLPLVAAIAIWAAALGVGAMRAPETLEAALTTDGPVRIADPANWTVTEGTLSIAVTQMGQKVSGTFAEWRAAIDFDEAPRVDGTLGSVTVDVVTGSLTLGAVTEQAVGEAFLASGTFPNASYRADILADEGAYLADGTFRLRDVAIPLRLPFELSIDSNTAAMNGTAIVDRRDFGIGEAYADETNVGFRVEIDVALTATRQP